MHFLKNKKSEYLNQNGDQEIMEQLKYIKINEMLLYTWLKWKVYSTLSFRQTRIW